LRHAGQQKVPNSQISDEKQEQHQEVMTRLLGDSADRFDPGSSGASAPEVVRWDAACGRIRRSLGNRIADSPLAASPCLIARLVPEPAKQATDIRAVIAQIRALWPLEVANALATMP
jgi:hypothetical protein